MTDDTITKKYKKKLHAVHAISWILCFGTTAILVAISLTGKKDGGESLRDVLGSAIYSFILTNIPLIFLSLLVKDKIKPVCWMANVIFANTIFGSAAIYVIFALWLIDTYILTWLKDLYRDRYRINKEIDKRG